MLYLIFLSASTAAAAGVEEDIDMKKSKVFFLALQPYGNAATIWPKTAAAKLLRQNSYTETEQLNLISKVSVLKLKWL